MKNLFSFIFSVGVSFFHLPARAEMFANRFNHFHSFPFSG
jgi:hypothetical protein